MISANRISDVETLLCRIFDDTILNSFDISYLEKIINYINMFVIQYYMDFIPRKIDFLGVEIDDFKNLQNFSSINDYLYCLRKYIFTVRELLLGFKDFHKGNNKIDQAIEYINKNYNKDINMATIANHLSLNYSYFSHLFSEKIGLSFSDYLKKFRIEKAKELLKTTNLKVNEISNKVGFNKIKSFTGTFHTLTGITPTDYRNIPGN